MLAAAPFDAPARRPGAPLRWPRCSYALPSLSSFDSPGQRGWRCWPVPWARRPGACSSPCSMAAKKMSTAASSRTMLLSATSALFMEA